MDERYMRLALQLAESARGQTSPNPLVGAVVVKHGEIVGFGAHLKAGEPHAEVHALRMAGEKAEGSTVYVTLEPCSHYGRTPPCADLLIEKKVKRVVVATTDPNPLVAGKGIEKLKRAGIDVTVGVLKEEADVLNEMFFHYISTNMPYVTLKYAMSLDGKIATKTGESKWITSEEARRDVHRERRMHDAIVVGVGTILADDPSLTVRFGHEGKQPIRVVLDTHLRTPLHANVVTDKMAPTWIVVGHHVTEEQMKPYEQAGVQMIRMNENKIDVPSLLLELGKRNVMSIFVEGGAQVHGSFLRSRSVQQVIAYIAPMLIGGNEAPSAIGGEGFGRMIDALRLQVKHVERIGPDIKIVAKG
ncbi:bifunctional diaminohydroxyphosphoribosylaminopyrimidine deaminase/5-amino-6-(5-phosphoribosylamino)uracil reductase [Anoxybacillus ayderensis]|uniref:bifunctional diaminohydroxyphosphoribosylaminopyrimidine deaminase/5-amino-6-(5-phosphoribosylamino)uracil reductase RibD n=1 Tax=Anoxybacillus sp. ST70 TaxID=2864180 RepID=UPI00031512D5|nr:bifunctional diaminohydroxyphosphoribosylaminopyrimidine deaminase/5-amino-6-(5-phosphoribosylamino)uracil reductase RibD [Anoxybacillus sp. ST70]AXM89988.1 bifunctional diaminohydroxyphosphoribosylaminopyrimidine deaminase/5-amino-6-(5-phosphoribosylamino)uracil reductase RibD [Anoxybacillus ayderensis G10]MBW9218083.1 bifunctional diaminohydroxyphosphoribosylaminopyrimidine deaminase/5-amino-6-(5-phosphoribosylamino)uracil reductase RibD [Anoxybacillus sp. ST70]THD17348.1 bifunctional diami